MQFILSKNSNGHLFLSTAFYIIISNFTTKMICKFSRRGIFRGAIAIYSNVKYRIKSRHLIAHKLKECLKPGWVPAFSTDGLKHFFYALTAHYGGWETPEDGGKPMWMVAKEFLYAQVIKRQKRHRLVEVEHRMMWGGLDDFVAKLKSVGLSGNINTAFVERVNLTIRQCISLLTRRTWGPAQYTPELQDHLYLWLAYYHFVRYHGSLRVKLDQPILRKG